MAVKTTDVRAWLREQGETVADRGPLPDGARERYEAVHLTAAGDPAGYPPADPPAGDPETASPVTAAGERPPRRVRPKTQPVRGLRRFWDQAGGKGKSGRRRPARDRQPVTSFVEGFYGQLAWSMGGIPPVQKLLYLQAPFAGTVAEANVRETAIDPLLQPLVRGEQAFKAVNGLLTPPVALMLILTKGRRLENGEPDPATQAMIGMLRFGLMAMLEVTGENLEQVIERGETLKARGDQADQLIAWLLAPPGDAGPDPESGEQADPVSAEEDAMARARDLLAPRPPDGSQ
jgi:hypothetical protein